MIIIKIIINILFYLLWGITFCFMPLVFFVSSLKELLDSGERLTFKKLKQILVSSI